MAFGSGWGFDGVTYDGKEMRELVETLTGGLSGVVGGTNALAVSQQAVATSTVKAAEGGAVIPATASGEGGSYQVYNDADLTSPTISPTAANGRKDRLILRVTSGVPALEVVQGVASGSPAEPSITGDNYLELALITLPASTTNITDAMITDRRARFAAGGTVICTSSTHPASPYEGQEIWETDTNRKFVYDGSAWQPIPAGRRFSAGLNTTALSGGNVVIAHGLGTTPTAVTVTLTSTNTGSVLQVARPYTGGKDATNFTVSFVRSDTGAALGSETVQFEWIAST